MWRAASERIGALLPPSVAERLRDIRNRSLKQLYTWRGSATLSVDGGAVRLRFLVDNGIEAEKIALVDEVEEEILRTLLDELRPGDVVFDVGGNIGLFSLPAAAKLRALGGRVVSFEPAPLWYRRLCENASLNALDNVDCHNVGLSDRAFTAEMVMRDLQGSGMGSIKTDFAGKLDAADVRSVPVSIVAGEAYMEAKGLSAPNIVKIDVEGAELGVLRGLANVLQRDTCRLLLIEVHPAYLDEPDERVTEVLESYGFTVERGGDVDDVYHVVARRKS